MAVYLFWIPVFAEMTVKMTNINSSPEKIKHDLQNGASKLGLNLSDLQIQQLFNYLNLIEKWNKVYNLTALRQTDEILTHHLFDSLAAVLPLQTHLSNIKKNIDSNINLNINLNKNSFRLLDVGSGGGLPGVVFAICCSDLNVVCVDAVAKKAAFVQQVALELKLHNLQSIHARVENIVKNDSQHKNQNNDKQKEALFDVISSRAFASLSDFTNWSQNALAPNGVWLAMKGKYPQEEISALPSFVSMFHVEQLIVPELNAERCIVWMKKI